MGTRANDLASLIKSGTQLDSSSIGVGAITQNKIANTVTLGLDSSAVNTLISENPSVDSAAVESIVDSAVGIKKIFNIQTLTAGASSFSPNNNANGALVYLQSGAGGGGAAQRNNNNAQGQNGGHAGMLMILVDDTTEYQSVSNVQVGSGGSGGNRSNTAGNAGNTGSTTWFGSSNLQAVGGGAGGDGNTSTGNNAGNILYNNTNSIGKRVASISPQSKGNLDFRGGQNNQIQPLTLEDKISRSATFFGVAGFFSLVGETDTINNTITTTWNQLSEGEGGDGAYQGSEDPGGGGHDGRIVVFEFK